jgi:hypothetical protein
VAVEAEFAVDDYEEDSIKAIAVRLMQRQRRR